MISDWFNRLPPAIKASLWLGGILTGGLAYGAILIWLPPLYALIVSVAILLAFFWFPLYWLYGGRIKWPWTKRR